MINFRGEGLHKPFPFQNTTSGIGNLVRQIKTIQMKYGLSDVLVAMEPTGHYWLPLACTLIAQGITVVMVNPHHVKKAKELDDNSPTKRDDKDAGVIARLARDGRFHLPYIPTGVLADIRNLVNFRERLNKELQQAKAEITTILDRYFPEFLDVFKSVEGKAAMAALENFPFPADLLERTVEEVASVLREATNKRVGGRHAELLQESARNSVGIKDGAEGARIDLQYQLRRVKQILDECKLVETRLAELLKEIPYAGYLLTIPGMSILQVATVVSEVGDLSNYRSARQLIKLAGLNLVENSSGSHKGRSRISKRGRSKLRCTLFRVALILVARTQEFSLLHHYYTTRSNNPLKGKQSLVAICCKLLRIIFALGQKKMVYDRNMVISQDHPAFKYMESAVKSKKAAA
ncbi:IS110 family transposase [Desulforamulus putei]|uniref:IS110 family transposase n=1 Tax=Desulforamulus putei TaxID=74701 RepID=UPI002FDD4DF1